MRSILVSALALLCLFAIAPPRPAARGLEEVRALWVTRATLVSSATISRMVESARAAGFNTVLVQVRARGDAYYRSRVEPRATAVDAQDGAFDPLQCTLREAHRAGLRVHAWISVNLVSSAVDLPASGNHVIRRHPEWLMVPRGLADDLHAMNPRSPRYVERLAGAVRRQPNEVEGLYLSPIDPEAAAYTVRVVDDIVSRYAVDGVHLDYIRYPGGDFDYSARALSLFEAHVRPGLRAADARALRDRETSNPLAYADRFPDAWAAFRRDRLTTLVERLHVVVKARRPAALLTAAVLPDAAEALDGRLQDWQAWARSGAIDAVCPMAYAADAAGFTAQVEKARRAAARRPVWAGIGAYRLSPAQTIEDIRIARRSGAAGVVLFSYDSLLASSPDGAPLSQIGRAAFQQPDE